MLAVWSLVQTGNCPSLCLISPAKGDFVISGGSLSWLFWSTLVPALRLLALLSVLEQHFHGNRPQTWTVCWGPIWEGFFSSADCRDLVQHRIFLLEFLKGKCPLQKGVDSVPSLLSPLPFLGFSSLLCRWALPTSPSWLRPQKASPPSGTDHSVVSDGNNCGGCRVIQMSSGA